MISSNLNDALEQVKDLVDQKIDELLPTNAQFNESRLVEAMRYSALSEGKRIRPFLIIAAADLFNIEPKYSVTVAAAIEFIHVYSLIHDDLPAMDDDDYRRGQLSCHKKFDEATAILAGDSLLTYAFQILSDPNTIFDPHIRCELICTIAKAIGFNGMAGGQMMDLEAAVKKDDLTPERIARLQRLKTGEMFMASVEAGAIIGKSQPSKRQSLVRYAHDIGLAFQIKDDILDHVGESPEKMRLNQFCKNNQDKTSIVNILGMDRAINQLNLLHDQAIYHLKPFGDKAALLKQLADFIVVRQR